MSEFIHLKSADFITLCDCRTVAALNAVCINNARVYQMCFQNHSKQPVTWRRKCASHAGNYSKNLPSRSVTPANLRQAGLTLKIYFILVLMFLDSVYFTNSFKSFYYCL